MHFTRLRLSGFKSFVEPTEFRIEPGLTGVVGPNGCGKSNLLEALRWVMGASSAKAMRGEGMDDVIFAGSGGRPSRNHAEVTLTVDNADRTAPARFSEEPVLEVTRRIDRGAGSSYRINGAEARARDVQLLFADASTGANSPALVRQGQISELIAAKPQNRRRILEEAAGVSGLHNRRHEAQLRVRGAEANLLRLDDLARELEAGLGRLRREARVAARYKTLSANIRTLQGAVLHARWAEAQAALGEARSRAEAARLAAETTARGAATAATGAMEAQTALPVLRDAATTAAAVLHHVDIEKDRLDTALAAARGEVTRLIGERRRVAADLERERQTTQDAAETLARLNTDIAQVEREIAAAPERTPELERAAAQAEAARVAADAALEQAAARTAAGEAEARGAAARLAEAKMRAARVQGAVDQALRDRAALGPDVTPALEAARVALGTALDLAKQAREALDQAETGRGEAAAFETTARGQARALEDELGRKVAEARGLARLTATATKSPFPIALDDVRPEAGLEAALAAALGDDLGAALDHRAESHWAGAAPPAVIWPEGVEPLSDRIQAPPQLAARLALTGLVRREDGPRLRLSLPPGARIVSREGDLWRWDGLTVGSSAPRPSQVRLEQRNQLAALEADIDALRPRSTAASEALRAAGARLAEADRRAREAREGPRAAERAIGQARETVERRQAEVARRNARAEALAESLARLETEQAEAAHTLAAAEAAVRALPAHDAAAGVLAEARREAAQARETAFAARAAMDREAAVRGGRFRRLEGLRRDHDGWLKRAATAERRQADLAREQGRVETALGDAQGVPDAVEVRRLRLLDELTAAQDRARAASDALTRAETGRESADRAARTAEALAADAREARAAAEAHLEAALARLEEQTRAILDATGLAPEDLGRRLSAEAVGLPGDAAGAETLLAGLERERDGLGAVNLLAEDEVADVTGRLGGMAAERADLTGALAKLKQAIEELNAEGRERLTAAFTVIDGHFRDLFTSLFQGGAAELRLVESEDPLEAGLEIMACPPGKRMAVMSLMSGGEQALTAVALIFAVFLANPAPICVLDEVDAPLDDANVERFCDLLAEMRRRAPTRFLTITHNPLTMSRMDRLYGVTMRERGVSQLVSVDLRQAEALAAR